MDVTIPCPCPEKDGEPRHESDTVTLFDVLDFHRATVVTKSVQFIDSDDDAVRSAEVLATLTEFYILMGIQRWTLRDASNKPVEVNSAAIRSHILGRPDIAAIVANQADDLYSKAILLPLLARASNFSPPSPTNGQTSPKRAGEQPKRPRPSRRSSISTIPMDATETTSSSLDGVSSSSLNSESAA